VLQLLRDAPARQAMGQAAQRVFEQESGATARLMQLVDARLQE